MLTPQPAKPAGRNADDFAEAPAAVTLVGESGGDGDLRERQLGLDEKMLVPRGSLIGRRQSTTTDVYPKNILLQVATS